MLETLLLSLPLFFFFFFSWFSRMCLSRENKWLYQSTCVDPYVMFHRNKAGPTVHGPFGYRTIKACHYCIYWQRYKSLQLPETFPSLKFFILFFKKEKKKEKTQTTIAVINCLNSIMRIQIPSLCFMNLNNDPLTS